MCIWLQKLPSRSLKIICKVLKKHKNVFWSRKPIPYWFIFRIVLKYYTNKPEVSYPDGDFANPNLSPSMDRTSLTLKSASRSEALPSRNKGRVVNARRKRYSLCLTFCLLTNPTRGYQLLPCVALLRSFAMVSNWVGAKVLMPPKDFRSRRIEIYQLF